MRKKIKVKPKGEQDSKLLRPFFFNLNKIKEKVNLS